MDAIREIVIESIERCRKGNDCEECAYNDGNIEKDGCINEMLDDALALLKERKSILQKLWHEFYAEEDKLEKKFAGTAKHNDWFFVYRPWLQKGFEIAIETIAKQEDKKTDEQEEEE